MTLRIGDLARSTRTNPPTIRYYEEIRLLPAPARATGGQRSYGEEDRRRLTFIRQCREFGFPIERVRSLVMLTEDSGRSCMEARAIAADHLGAVREKLAELRKQLRRRLRRRPRTRLCNPPGYGKSSIAWEKSETGKERPVIKTAPIYAAAAFFEIAGCFSLWLWLREGKSVWWTAPGTISLLLFAWLLTQVNTAAAGRAYAAYGGVYI